MQRDNSYVRRMASRITSIGTGSRLSVPSDDSNVPGITHEGFLNDTVVSTETSNEELRPAKDNSDGILEPGPPSVTSNMGTAMGPFSSHFPTVEQARNILRDFESDTVATVSRSPSISASSTANGNNEQKFRLLTSIRCVRLRLSLQKNFARKLWVRRL